MLLLSEVGYPCGWLSKYSKKKKKGTMLAPHELSPKGGGIWTVAYISQYSFSSLDSQSVITTKKTDAYIESSTVL